ncbi:anthranilate synthase component I family protein [Flavobacterium arcticum]|uniref:Anthranilate synthase component I family protein n=1 Tax=Flavobacterium arcticum TaxID=1784713 RepID=A0A345HD51_9FLAO|nr:anthranilate synthase component I family protein [Flavobacterium arcticum]AXG74511.1 anthranilate synthase component I family protein [Flavobacterium arcticum]KAF2512368.1 anthranilate synthase component I family protein [Flavobacterium arcticum]
MRTSISQTIQNPKEFKKQLLQWAQQFREVVFLDSNDYHREYNTYDAVLAVDALTAIQTDYNNVFEDLNTYQQITKDWIFGYLSYDLKNDTEKLESNNFDGLDFPDLFFFQPKKLFLIKDNQLEIAYLNMCDDEIDIDLKEIENLELIITNDTQQVVINQRISKESYIDKVGDMLAHIHRGDIYEANFCMEFYAEEAIVNPLETYEKLNTISEPPFATYFKNHQHYLLSASPERYIKKEGSKIISQPIKGTARRSADVIEDEAIKQELVINEKERSENIMIVDLVRNDLSRTAAKGSVNVEELCAVYSFKQVHHLISTITSQVAEGHTPVDVIKSTFPMGSMTGAPKISAMEIIEKLEETKRGLYSGAVGYFTPNGDFDFNVVIRSILYNSSNKYVSFSVGSAITSKSDPEKEYEECLLKAKAMLKTLEV